MPLLINPDGSKLSKRAGDVRVEDYIARRAPHAPRISADVPYFLQNRGYEPEALLNFVALMGWSRQAHVSVDTPAPQDGDTSEVLTMQDLIDNVRRISASLSRYNINLLPSSRSKESTRIARRCHRPSSTS